MLWTLLFWIGGFVVLVVGGLMGLLVFIRVVMSRMERRIRRDGRPILTTMMMANNSLHDPDGRSQVPGVVVFSFDQPSPQLAETLRITAQRCFELYTAPDPNVLPPTLRQFALLLKDDIYDADRRNLVPTELSGYLPVYVADLWLHRDRLISGWHDHRVVACAVTGTHQGEIVMLAPDDPAAVQVYTAAGVMAPAVVTSYPGSFQAPPKPLAHVEDRSAMPVDSGTRDTIRVLGCLAAAVGLCVLLCVAGGYLLHVALSPRAVVAENDKTDRAPSPPRSPPSNPPTYTMPREATPRLPQPPRQQQPPSSFLKRESPGPAAANVAGEPGEPLPPGGFAPRPQQTLRRPAGAAGGGTDLAAAPRTSASAEPTETVEPAEPTEPKVRPPGVSPPGVQPPNDRPPNDRPPTTPTPAAAPPAGREPAVEPPSEAPSPTAAPPSATWGADTLRIPFRSKDEITFGPIGCPIVVVGNDVWHFKQKKIVRQLAGEYNQHGMKALSGNGQWFAVASKSPNQKDTAIDVWNVVAGRHQCTIAGDPEKFRDLIQFSRNRYLLLGGRLSSELEVWDVESGEQLPSITAPSRRVDAQQVALTPDGEYFTSVVDEKLTVFQLKNQKAVAVMESPQPQVDPDKPLNAIQRKIAIGRVMSMIKIIRFSPSGDELAIVSDSGNPRLCCWNATGKLVFDEFLPRVQHAFFFRPTFDWLPDGSGWIVSGHLVDRETKRIVLAIRLPFAEDPLFFPLDRDHLVGAFPHDPKTLQVLEIPWDRIHASLQLLQDNAPALLSPFQPVSIELELKGLRGDAAAVESVLTAALSERLQADGLAIAPGRPAVFRLRFSERAGDTLPIYERQSPFDLRGRDTGRTATEAEGSLVVEFAADGKVLWRDTLKASSSGSFREEINDGTIRASMLENLTRQMNRLSIPYFIPAAPDQLALPVMIE